MLMSKERPVRDFIGKHLSLGGREVKVTVFQIACIVFDFDFGRIGNRSSSTEVGLDRSPIDPKLKSKLGVGMQEDTRQYREAKEANLFA